jgi:DNA-directed RNA polymerase subunit RPC12/RpoP
MRGATSSDDGTDSRRATAVAEAETGSRTFPCEGCGADFEFHIGEQSLKCPYCGFVKQLTTDPEAAVAEQDFEAMLARLVELRDGNRRDEQGFREIDCEACGATVRFSGTLTSSECAYCGSPLQLADAHEAPHRVPVDGVLPFLVDRETARKNLAAWVRSRWFTPSAFRKRGVQGRFNGLYAPYWTFDTLTTTHYTGQRGEHYYVTVGGGKKRRRVRRTRWYPASGTFRRFFDDLLIVAASGLPAKRVRALEPWPLGRSVPFNPELLAGFLARTYDVELDRGFSVARERIDDALRSEVRQRIGGDTQRIHSVNSSYGAVTYKHLLLPVWMLAYRFRDKAYQVVVNAGTGEVQGDRPYSWVKISLAALAALVVAAVTYFLVR